MVYSNRSRENDYDNENEERNTIRPIRQDEVRVVRIVEAYNSEENELRLQC